MGDQDMDEVAGALGTDLEGAYARHIGSTRSAVRHNPRRSRT